MLPQQVNVQHAALRLQGRRVMGYDLRKGTPGQLEDVDDAAEKTARFLEEGHEVE